MQPFFSIVIPTYNRAYEVQQLIGQVLNQTFLAFEVIVVDDGSTDDTKEFFRTQIDERIRYFRTQNGERGRARNFGASIARGLYLNFFDSDDEMLSSHLDVAFHLLTEDRTAILCLNYMNRAVDGVLRPLDPRPLTIESLLFDNFISINSLFVRSDVFKDHQFCEDRRLSSSEDWELWIRLAARFPFRFSQEVTSYVIFHPQRSLSTLKPERLEERDRFLIQRLRADEKVMSCYGNNYRRFCAERYTYFMLKYSEERKRFNVIRCAFSALYYWPLIIFTRRFLASIRNIIMKNIC